MKMKFTLAFIAVFFFLSNGFSQIQFWSDAFEDAGSPSSGSRTPSSDFSCILAPSVTPTSYFTRTTPGSLNLNSTYSGFQGSKVWAGENLDVGGGAVGSCTESSQSFNQTISWAVNITGKSGLSFKGFFGANNISGGNWDPIAVQPASYDFLLIEYNIDGGAWTKIIEFYATGTTASTTLSLDTDGNLIGDGTALSYALAEFAANISGTGTTLNLRFSASSNNTSNEEFAIDNFRLFETAACTAPTITTNPPTNSDVCAGGNKTISGAATGATAFKWQYDTGSGFTDVPNSAPYSNVTTNTLTITGATAGMNGYDYRLVAINGVASCFTNSNSSNLRVSAINTSSNTQTNVACNGGNTGNATVIPSGGITSSYSYSWSPSGGTGATASNLTQGSYTVTVTDNILTSCTATQNFTITQPPVLNGSTVVTNVSCNGGTNGAINLTPSGGAGGYTFSWGGGITTEDRTGLAAATYAVIITDANGCTKNVTGITVTQPTAAVGGTTTVTNTTCNGATNGVIDLTPTGGTSPYTYSWGGGVTTQDRISLAAGTYSVTITDNNGCTGTVSGITVTQPTAVSGSTTVTNTSCNGGTNGSIDLTPTGGTPGYTYSWGGGITSQDRISLAAGTYSVTITDANACTGTVSGITVTQPTAVSGSTTVTNVACFGNSTGAINLTPTGGTGPYTFSWGGGITTEDRISLTAGSYSVTITDANACTGTVNVTVTQPAAVVSGTTVVTNVACFGGNTGAINLTPTGGTGPYTFNWVGGATTEDRTLLTAGTYSVTITDANACTGTVSGITVTQPAAAVSGTRVVTNVSCFGGNNGAINLTPTGGTGPYTFNWAGGATTEDRTGLTAGTYNVTVTDANGCTGTVPTITVTQPSFPVSGTTVVTNVACFGNNTGSINLTPTGGTGPYTESWGGGITTEDRTGLTAGTYSVTITDVNGCTGTVSPTVTQPASALSGTTVVTNVACFGNNTGAINLTPAGGTGPYTFNWVGGATTEDRTLLTAGTYSVTITDANACTATVSGITVTQPTAAVSGTTIVTNVSCNSGTNGAINLTPTGGTGPYTFSWGGGVTTEDRTGLAAGTYSVTITDANACTGTVSGITVTQPTAISVTASAQTNVSCNGGSNGAAAINTPTGGTPGYTYNWTPGTPTGDGTTSVTGLTAGTWTVNVTDANGCVASQAFTVTQPTAISFTAAAQTNVACFGNTTGSFTVNPALGGAGSFTYDWAPGTPTGDGTTTVTGLAAGTYSVTATDANSCTATITFTITQPTALSVTPATQTNLSCFGGSNGAAAINTPTGGTPGYTYDWSLGTPVGDGTTSITGLTAGTWTCNVTDANGCTASQSFTVTQPTALSVTPASQTNVACNGGSTGAAAINTPTGGAGGYTYDWDLGTPVGDGTTSINGLTAGTWTCNVTDANGCTASQSFTVTQPTAISVTAASQTNIACFGGSTGAAAINTPTGGTPGYTYDWDPGTPIGDGSLSVTGLTAGTWTVNVTDANGCTASQSFTVTQPAAITNTVSATSCDSYTLNGTTYNTSGTYTQVLTSGSGCDSTLTLNLTINNSTTEILNETQCSSYTLNGTTYNTSGTYTQTLMNAVGCDSTITLNLVINQPTSVTLTETACDDYTLNGTTYNTSGTYTQLLTNAAGCDSVITLNLTINNATSSSIITSACDSYTLNGQTYTTSGTHVQTIMNAAGCDSVITLTLTINQSSSSSSSEFACGSYTWAQNGMTYTASGVYMDTIPNTTGCDSVITLNLTIGGSSATQNVTVCESYTWNQTGITYTASGMYSDTLTDVNGCDSVLILNLTVTGLPSASITNNGGTLTASSGTTYQWLNCNGTVAIIGATSQTFAPTSNGSYSVVVTNAAGCSDTAACVVVTGLGLEELDSQSVQVFPNPTENQVTITMTFAQANLVITDVQGKTHYTGQISNGQLINLAQYADGVYILSIETESGKILKRIVKN